MSTIYLHIGTPKTGTTSLQNFFWDNREALEKNNICYPDFGFRYPGIGFRRNGHFLVTTKYRDENNKRILEKEREDYIKGLDFLTECAESYSRIILSDEGIWRASLYNRENFWENLKKDLDARKLDLKIVVYLRRQDLFVQSQWIQKVKEGAIYDFKTYLDDISRTGYPLNYYEYLHKLECIFGKEALIVRAFEKGQFLGEENTIQSDFLNIFGLKIADGFTIKQEFYNESLEGNYLEMKRILNSLDEFHNGRHALIKDIKQIQKRKLFKDNYEKKTYFEEGAQEAYLDQFEESNASVAREYLGREDGKLFYDGIRNLPRFTVKEDQLLRDTIVVYAKMFDILGEENEKLKEKNKVLEQEVKELKKESKEQTKELRQMIQELQKSALLFRLKRKTKHMLGKDK